MSEKIGNLSRDIENIFQKPNEAENWHSFIDTSKKMPLLTSLTSIDNDTDIKTIIKAVSASSL